MNIDRQILDSFLEKVETVVKQAIGEVKSDINGIKSDVSTLKSDVSTLREDVSTLKSEVSTLKEDVSTLKEDVGMLKSEMAEVKSDISVMNVTLQEHTDLLRALEHRTEENTAQLLQISEDLNYLKGTVASQGKEIDELKMLRSEDRRIIEAVSAMVIKHESQLKTMGV
ncbi:hypothetical protein [Thermincola potens]|uniref:M penetrans paralogue 2 domain protein n=1 Tax=Thermincola potens (strain JR) TaxID=635013 RepID=D5XBS1_THEPJ|nr:hypothetical protein [Thermincola potens]ADG81469.1 M penetrans paralogue 2 domain protein [Thermincola potens JR]